jgi:hypothetical protein
VEALSLSDQSWMETLGKLPVALCLLIPVGLIFSYISGATRQIGSKVAPSDGPDVDWNTTPE